MSSKYFSTDSSDSSASSSNIPGDSSGDDDLGGWGSRWQRRTPTSRKEVKTSRRGPPSSSDLPRSSRSLGIPGRALDLLPDSPERGRSGAPRPNAIFPVSRELHALLSWLERTSEEEIRDEGLEEEAKDPSGRNRRPSRAPTMKDWMLLAEVIELYLLAAPKVDPQADGVTTEDRALMISLAREIREKYGDGGRSKDLPPEFADISPLYPKVINTAPPGRLPWEILGVDEERAVVHCAVDLTGGKASDPFRNSRLSYEVKKKMWKDHNEDPKTWTIERLAQEYRISQQRVMAILALKDMEAEKKIEEDPEAMKVTRAFYDHYRCWEHRGSGERHHVILPSRPNYKEVDESMVREKLGKRSVTNQEEEEAISSEAAAQALGLRSQEEIEDELAAREEEMLVKEFKRALDYNLGKIGTGIHRKTSSTLRPRRPPEGWSLVIKPLGKEAKEKKVEPYVAQPDGTKRALNESEALYMERKTPKPRRKII